MLCAVCKTRLHPGNPTCPNCGARSGRPGGSAVEPYPTNVPLPTPDPTLSDTDTDTVPEESAAEAGESNESSARSAEPGASEKAGKSEQSAKAAASPTAPPRGEPGGAAVAAKSGSGAGAPQFSADAAGLRSLLASEPEQLEKGLTLLCDDKGKPIGAGYNTGVGDIDLLARDAKGGLVVVMVSEQAEGEALVSEVLQRIGWVRKHVGKSGDKVRGIVLVQDPPESLSYAAAAVADTVSLKTWRVALSFDDLEI